MMTNNLMLLNKSALKILDEIKKDLTTGIDIDDLAYYELSQVLVHVDQIASIMLSEIENERVLN